AEDGIGVAASVERRLHSVIVGRGIDIRVADAGEGRSECDQGHEDEPCDNGGGKQSIHLEVPFVLISLSALRKVLALVGSLVASRCDSLRILRTRGGRLPTRASSSKSASAP